MVNDHYACKFWRKSFDPHVKDHFDYPANKMFSDMFMEAVNDAPDVCAVNCMGREITFSQLDALWAKY